MIIPSTDQGWLDALKTLDNEFLTRCFNYADFINRCDRHAHYADKQGRALIADHLLRVSHNAWIASMKDQS